MNKDPRESMSEVSLNVMGELTVTENDEDDISKSELPTPCFNSIENGQLPEFDHSLTKTDIDDATSHIPELPTDNISCPHCEEKFCSLTMFDIHLMSHKPQFKCTHSGCESVFMKRHTLAQHMLVHEETRRYTCETCEKSFKRKGDLVQHSKNHTGERPFACNVCGKKFMRSSYLYQHQRTHTGERQALYKEFKPHKCSHCSRNFHRKTDMEEHERTHTDERPYVCLECGKGFRKQYHLKQHMPVHSRERNYSCLDCQKTFMRQNELYVHLQKHKDSPIMLICDLCEAVYQTDSEFQRHKLRHGNDMAMCKECGEMFCNKKTMEKHQAEEHAV